MHECCTIPLILLIDNYTSLQRIKKSEDTEKELDYQIKILKAKLELYSVKKTYYI